MGRIILIDGPEKTGKSTLIKELTRQLDGAGVQVHHRRWGQVKPDDRAYTAPLQQDLDSKTKGVTIWDRGWPSEHVYGKLLNRPRRGATNPWILEWLHGRALVARGAKVILVPTDYKAPLQFRDDTDLPVDVGAEYRGFVDYGRDFCYDIYSKDYTAVRDEQIAANIIYSLPDENPISARYLTYGKQLLVPGVRLIVGEQRNPNDYKTMAGAWLPFSSAKMCRFVQQYFGDKAFRFAWTNAEDISHGLIPRHIIQNASEVFTFGKDASNVVQQVGVLPNAAFAHPAFFARWNTDKGRAALKEFERTYKVAFDLLS